VQKETFPFSILFMQARKEDVEDHQRPNACKHQHWAIVLVKKVERLIGLCPNQEKVVAICEDLRC